VTTRAPRGPTTGETIEAAWTWIGNQFESRMQIKIDADGSIASVDPVDAGSDPPDRRLAHSALLPGFVNAHSHAFQRGLRGHGEVGAVTASDFWNWRDAMYRLVEELDESRFYELTLAAFREMRSCGITTVGEFHYLHHRQAHNDQRGDFDFDGRVLEAAAEAGIRLVLLQAFYGRGGIGKELSGAQNRFATRSLDEYWRQFEHLESCTDPATQSLGVVAHSIRSASPEQIVELYTEARRRGLVFHIHLEEQKQEIEDSVLSYGMGPLALLNERLDTAAGLTAIHCTHSTPTDLARFAIHGGFVCVCPTTEANLADGIPDLPAFLGSGGQVCLGTDSNLRISMTEEMRWLEHAQRLRLEKRGIVGGSAESTALVEAATRAGAQSLGIESGRIAAGAPADLVEINLDHPILAGWSPQTLLPSLVFGGGDEAVISTCVAGNWRQHRRAV